MKFFKHEHLQSLLSQIIKRTMKALARLAKTA